MRTSIYFLLLVCFVACSKDSSTLPPPPPKEPVVLDPEIEAYLNSFIAEAELRGVDLNLEFFDLTFEILEINRGNVAGTCSYNSFRNNHVTLDATYWNTATENNKEKIFFHELGHCILERGHREDTYANGACISIMRSGLEGCFDNYNINTRSLYLDELFLLEFRNSM